MGHRRTVEEIRCGTPCTLQKVVPQPWCMVCINYLRMVPSSVLTHTDNSLVIHIWAASKLYCYLNGSYSVKAGTLRVLVSKCCLCSAGCTEITLEIGYYSDYQDHSGIHFDMAVCLVTQRMRFCSKNVFTLISFFQVSMYTTQTLLLWGYINFCIGGSMNWIKRLKKAVRYLALSGTARAPNSEHSDRHIRQCVS